MTSYQAERTAAAMSASDSGDSATVLSGNKSVFPTNAGRCIQDSVGRYNTSLTLRFKWLHRYDYLALGKSPQQRNQPQKSRRHPEDSHASRKSGLVLRRILFYPGLPNTFVEFGNFIGLQHNSLINHSWFILTQY